MATSVELAQGYISLIPSAKGIGPKTQAIYNPMVSQAEGAGRKAGGRFSAGLKRAATGAGGLLAAYGGVKLFTNMISEAGKFEQSVGAIQSVFKSSSKEMTKFANQAVQNVGLSKNEYNELATVIGAQLKNGGVAMDQLSGKTNGLITVGADLASMFGGTTKDAVGALSSALRGERDPIERYGITLTAASVEAEALKMGLMKAGGEMSQSAKTAATMSLIMKQSADAQGNFARESDTFANKQQKMAAQWKNVQMAIGQFFIPIATKAFEIINDKILPVLAKTPDFLRSMGRGFRTAGRWIQDNIGWLSMLVAGIGGYILAVKGMAIATAIHKAVTTSMKGMTVAQWALNAAMKANPIGIVVAALAALVAGAVWAYKEIGWFRDMVNSAWRGIKVAAQAVANWFMKTVWPTMVRVWRGIGKVAVWLWKNAIKPAWRGIRIAAQVVVGWFRSFVLPVIRTVFRAVGAIFTWLWKNIVKPVFRFIRAYIKVWWTIVKAIFQLVVAFVRHVLAPAISWFWKNVVKPVFNWIGKHVSAWWNKTVKPIFRTVWNWLKKTLGPAFRWFRDSIIKPVWNRIKEIIGGVWKNGIKPIFNSLRDFIKETIPAAFRVGVNAVDNIFSKLRSIAAAPVRFVIGTVLNKGLIKGFNWIADKLPGVDKLNPIPMPNWAKGNSARSGGGNAVGGPVRFFAKGGHAPPGYAIVGEEGPELIHTSRDSWISTAKQTKSAMAANGIGGSTPAGMWATPLAAMIRRAGGLLNIAPSSAANFWQMPGAAGVLSGASGLKIRMGMGAPRIDSRIGGLPVPGAIAYANFPNNITFGPGGGRFSPTFRRATAIHEIMHLLGFPHTAANSIMNPVIGRNMVPTGRDIGLLRQLFHGGSGKLGSGAVDAGVKNPLFDIIGTMVDKFWDKFQQANSFAKLAWGVGKKILSDATGWIGDKIGGITDKLWDVAKIILPGVGAKAGGDEELTSFDQGGWLESRGRSGMTGANFSRKPEPVLTTRQWEIAEGNMFGNRFPEQMILVVEDGPTLRAYVRRESVDASMEELDHATTRWERGGRFVRRTGG